MSRHREWWTGTAKLGWFLLHKLATKYFFAIVHVSQNLVFARISKNELLDTYYFLVGSGPDPKIQIGNGTVTSTVSKMIALVVTS